MLSRLDRVREGASALVGVARTVWDDPSLRRFYLRVATTQALVTLVVGLLAVSLFLDDDEPRREGKRPKSVVVSVDGAKKKKDQSIVIKNERHTIVIGPDGVDVRPADSSAAAASGGPGASAAPSALGEGEGEDEDGDDDKSAKAGGRPGPRVLVQGEIRGDDDEDDDETALAAGGEGREEPKSRLKAFWGKVVAIYGIFVGAGWCVVALSRDYHDVIGREASLRLGLPPEDPPVSPRVRLNVPWVKTRVKRRIRGFLLFTLGAPPLWTFSFFVVLPLVGFEYVWDVLNTSAVISRLYGLLAAAWGGYWLIVFTTAKTQLAWADEHQAPDPWFLRLWGAFTRRLPAALAWLPRGYGRAWFSMSRQVFAPAACVERAPYEFGGLAALRLVGSVPGLYPFVRPLVPVAAALLVKRHCPAPAAAGPYRGGAPGDPPGGPSAAPSPRVPPR